MPALLQKIFKIVPAPLLIEAVPKAPPVLEALNPSVECKCGNCGTILMRGDETFASPAARTIRRKPDLSYSALLFVPPISGQVNRGTGSCDQGIVGDCDQRERLLKLASLWAAA